MNKPNVYRDGKSLKDRRVAIKMCFTTSRIAAISLLPFTQSILNCVHIYLSVFWKFQGFVWNCFARESSKYDTKRLFSNLYSEKPMVGPLESVDTFLRRGEITFAHLYYKKLETIFTFFLSAKMYQRLCECQGDNGMSVLSVLPRCLYLIQLKNKTILKLTTEIKLHING